MFIHGVPYLCRLQVIRDVIGYERRLMVDANQRWDVPEAITNMEKLAPFKITWIEEPVSPDDVLGHASVAKVCVRVCVCLYI